MGSFRFSDIDSVKLLALYDDASSHYQTDMSASGIFQPLYGALIEIISSENPIGLSEPETGVDTDVWLWIRGAADVNADDGFFAAFIRDYTLQQFELRYGSPPANPDELVQQASNSVANNFFSDIANRLSMEDIPNALPTIREIGLHDAGAAASEVFDGVYAPWAGTLLFAYLGVNDFFYEWILTSNSVAGDDGTGIYREFVRETGTYDLVAAISASDAATQSAFNPIELYFDFYNYVFLPSLDEQALADSTNQYFREYYGLSASEPWSPGDDLIFNGLFTSLFGPKFSVGTLFDDNNLQTTEGSDVLNSGPGDDAILGSGGYDLIDGSEGFDSVEYVDAPFQYSLQRVGSAIVVDRKLAGNTIDADYLYSIERIIYPEFRANTTTDEIQRQSSAAQVDGGFAVVWVSQKQVDGQSLSIVGRRFDENGNPLSTNGRSEFVVSETVGTTAYETKIASLQDGGFVVVWQGRDEDGPGRPLKTFVRLYDSGGNPKTGELIVFENPQTDDVDFNRANFSQEQGTYDVAVLSDGSIAIVTEASSTSAGNPFDGTDIQLQVLSGVTGEPLIDDTIVNTVSQPGRQFDPSVTALVNTGTGNLANGGFIVSWTDVDDSDSGVWAQVYGADYIPVGGTIQLNSASIDDVQGVSSIAGLREGGYVAVWTDFGTEDGGSDIRLLQVGPNGAVIHNSLTVNVDFLLGNQMEATVIALEDGGYIVSWTDGRRETDGGGSAIVAQQFDALGHRVGDNFVVNVPNGGSQRWSDIAALPEGDFLFTWTGSQGGDDVYYRLYTNRSDSDAGRSEIEIDDEDLFRWASRERVYDGDDELVQRVVIFDDGRIVDEQYSGGVRTARTTTDPENVASFESITVIYGENGLPAQKITTRDDGRIIVVSYSEGMQSMRTTSDPDNAVSHDSIVVIYDENGLQAEKTTTYDDGRIAEDTYANGVRTMRLISDPEDAFAYESKEVLYDDDGNRSQKTIVFDDGRIVVKDFTPDPPVDDAGVNPGLLAASAVSEDVFLIG